LILPAGSHQGLPGDGHHGHGMWLRAELQRLLIRRSARLRPSRRSIGCSAISAWSACRYGYGRHGSSTLGR